jgi:RNA polymerase sigma-70 factor (ECF subfamily)
MKRLKLQPIELFPQIEPLSWHRGDVATSTQEAYWVLRLQCGDREAFEPLIAAVQPSLRRYIARLAGIESVDDLLQDVLIIVCRKVAWLEDPKLFRPWVFRIASRAAFRHLKKGRRRLEEPIDQTVLDRAATSAAQPSEQDLERFLDSDALSAASRAVLVLHFEEDMTLVEVAAVLEIPLGTVKSRLASGLATLRKELQKGRL